MIAVALAVAVLAAVAAGCGWWSIRRLRKQVAAEQHRADQLEAMFTVVAGLARQGVTHEDVEADRVQRRRATMHVVTSNRSRG